MPSIDARVHRLVVPRTARYVSLGAVDGDISEMWLLCHGYAQLAGEFLDSARALESPHRLLVAPEGLSRFYHEDHVRIGASWMTREDRLQEMDDYVRYLDLVHEQVSELVGATRLVVFGYSQGAATAARWAVRGRGEVDHLVLWGAAAPPELDDEASLAPLASMQVTLVAGTRDTLFPEDAREEQRARLTRNGVSYTELSFDGGHRLDDDTLRELENS